jgi:hypothetical protein
MPVSAGKNTNQFCINPEIVGGQHHFNKEPCIKRYYFCPKETNNHAGCIHNYSFFAVVSGNACGPGHGNAERKLF